MPLEESANALLLLRAQQLRLGEHGLPKAVVKYASLLESWAQFLVGQLPDNFGRY